MACRAPISVDTPNGPVHVRCKQCLNCRISKQSAISLRALLESRSSLSAEFWTLTYEDAPETGTWSDFSKFLKRYRTWNVRNHNPVPIRYLGCGEYGSKSGRFHYHALLFNGLPAEVDSQNRLWPHGFVYIGQVTPASIRYTARYCLKFNDGSREPMASWSKGREHPDASKSTLPLGAAGMIELANYMRRDGRYKVTSPPTALKIEGRNYTVDETMQKYFWDAFHHLEDVPRRTGIATRTLDYMATMRLGDPLERDRRAQEERNTFWESARIVSDTI